MRPRYGFSLGSVWGVTRRPFIMRLVVTIKSIPRIHFKPRTKAPDLSGIGIWTMWFKSDHVLTLLSLVSHPKINPSKSCTTIDTCMLCWQCRVCYSSSCDPAINVRTGGGKGNRTALIRVRLKQHRFTFAWMIMQHSGTNVHFFFFYWRTGSATGTARALFT